MSKNELTSGDQNTIIRSKEPTVITTTSGKVESTEEATVHVNDLDVFCRSDAVGRFTVSTTFSLVIARLREEIGWENPGQRPATNCISQVSWHWETGRIDCISQVHQEFTIHRTRTV